MPDISWRWPWESQPETPPTPQPVPNNGKTATQNAEDIIDRYWRWAQAGAQTVDSGQKDSKGQPIPVAVNPDTGQPDPNFPTLADINAARELISTQKNETPDQKAQAQATLDETLKRTELLQAQIDKAKANNPPQTVTPGEGVYNPATGKYDVPIPPKGDQPPQAVSAGSYVRQPDGTYTPVGPQRSQAQIDAESGANVTQSNAAAAAAQSSAWRNSAAGIKAEYDAKWQSALAEKQALVNSGLELSEQDKLELQHTHDMLKAQMDADLKQAQTQFEHDLNQPNVDRQLNVSEESANTQAAQVENNRIDQERTARIRQGEDQANILKAQSEQGQNFVDNVVKSGADRPLSMSTLKLAIDPLQIALQLMGGMAQNGQVPQSAIPTFNPQAPAPANSAAAAPMPARPDAGTDANPATSGAPAPAGMAGGQLRRY
jgi:hypothetical protein